MGKYIKLYFENEEEKKEIIENFKFLYERHIKIEKNQFLDDFGNLKTPEDLLEEGSSCDEYSGYDYFQIKISMLNQRFFTDAFISDLTYEILSR